MELQKIQNSIYTVRGRQVMLDRDLAALYGVETKQLKRQVRRHLSRFPTDFMIELTAEEWAHLRCQIDTSSWGGVRYAPFVFTEQGVAMLSSVLLSEAAVQVNIQIMRAFTQLRNSLSELAQTKLRQETIESEIKRLECYIEEILHDQNDTNESVAAQLEAISQTLTELQAQPPQAQRNRPRIGFN